MDKQTSKEVYILEICHQRPFVLAGIYTSYERAITALGTFPSNLDYILTKVPTDATLASEGLDDKVCLGCGRRQPGKYSRIFAVFLMFSVNAPIIYTQVYYLWDRIPRNFAYFPRR